MRPARSSGAGGLRHRAGDRVAIWCFNCAEWVVAVLGIFSAGAVLVPVNTRFKGAEAADILVRSRARVLVTVTDFLGTDYVAMLEAHRDRAARPRDRRRRPRADGPTGGAVGWADFLARATAEAAGRGRTGAAPRSGPTTRRTSSSRRAPRASPRASCMTHGRTLTRRHRLGRHDRPQRRRRLPAGQPVLPHVRPQGRDPGQRRRRRDHAPRAGVRRRPGALTASRRSSVTVLPGRARRSTSRSSTTPTATRTTSRACGSP